MMLKTVQSVNLLLRFLLELAILAAIAFWGFSAWDNVGLKLATGVGIPLVIAAFWALFMAPSARRRLRSPVRHVAELPLFGAGVLALAAAGQPAAAAVFVLLYALNKTLMLVWKQ